MKRYFLLLSFFFSSFLLTDEKDALCFKEEIFYLVSKSIAADEEIKEKEKAFLLLDHLKEKAFCLTEGDDELRIPFVICQGAFEKVFTYLKSKGEIVQLTGIIHTPTPATPLCTHPDKEDPNLVNPLVEWSLEKLFTIRSRARILREYLAHGGILYVAYPMGGLEKRTNEQRQIYLEAKERFSPYLVDVVLHTDTMDSQMIGATYFFTAKDGSHFAFSLQGTQANASTQKSTWGIWFGEISEDPVRERTDRIVHYLEGMGVSQFVSMLVVRNKNSS